MVVSRFLSATLASFALVYGTPHHGDELHHKEVGRHENKMLDGADLDSDTDSTTSPNIIFIMLDDIGHTDLGPFGAGWETPAFDSFKEESIYLDHHYIGFVCSASRSQFLTGRYAWNLGYGELDVFTEGKFGGIPLGVPNMAEYLKSYGNYKTYAIGKWQLGQAFDEQTPLYRGFDYFYGFYGGQGDYYDKTAPMFASGSAPVGTNYPDYVTYDNTWYLDFFENGEACWDGQNGFSTDQYFNKMQQLISEHSTNVETQDQPFYLYAGFQVAHGPFPGQRFGYREYESEYEDICQNTYNDDSDMCIVMANFDKLFSEFMEYMKSDDMKEVYDNTIIVFTADNGGELRDGCNYPFRGGKNTYFEGNQRVPALIGGGYVPESRRGITLGGLMSNVDWVPTLLSFANLVPHSYKQVTLEQESTDEQLELVFDGYNLYDYIMNDNAIPVRDHIVFNLNPKLSEDETNELAVSYDELFEKDIDEISSIDDLSLDEIAILFFDDEGTLWKYVSAEFSTNELGAIDDNSQWCDLNTGYNSDEDDDSLYILKDSIDESYEYDVNDVVYSLYDITNDVREMKNYFADVNSGELDDDKIAYLESIVIEKASQYLNKNVVGSRSQFVYGTFDCFYNNWMDLAWPGYFDSVFEPFITKDRFITFLSDTCNLPETHSIYRLHAESFDFDKYHTSTKLKEIVNDESSLQQERNQRAISANDEIEDAITIGKSTKENREAHFVKINSKLNTNNYLSKSTLLIIAGSIVSIAVFGLIYMCLKNAVFNGNNNNNNKVSYQAIRTESANYGSL